MKIDKKNGKNPKIQSRIRRRFLKSGAEFSFIQTLLVFLFPMVLIMCIYYKISKYFYPLPNKLNLGKNRKFKTGFGGDFGDSAPIFGFSELLCPKALCSNPWPKDISIILENKKNQWYLFFSL